MARLPAFHTNSLKYPSIHRNVYHDRSDCRQGQEIKREVTRHLQEMGMAAMRRVHEVPVIQWLSCAIRVKAITGRIHFLNQMNCPVCPHWKRTSQCNEVEFMCCDRHET